MARSLRLGSGLNLGAPHGLPLGVTVIVEGEEARGRPLLDALVAAEGLCRREVVLVCIGRDAEDHASVVRRSGAPVPTCVDPLQVLMDSEAPDATGWTLQGDAILAPVRAAVEAASARGREVTLVVDDVDGLADCLGGSEEKAWGVVKAMLRWGGGADDASRCWTRMLLCGGGHGVAWGERRSAAAEDAAAAEVGAEASRAVVAKIAAVRRSLRSSSEAVVGAVEDVGEVLASVGLSSVLRSHAIGAASSASSSDDDDDDDGRFRDREDVGGGVMGMVRSVADLVLELSPLPSGRSKEVTAVVRARFQPCTAAVLAPATSSLLPLLQTHEGHLHATAGAVELLPRQTT